MKRRLTLLFALAATLLAPLASAAPTILPTSSSLVSVTSSDSFALACGATEAGRIYTITTPTGLSIQATQIEGGCVAQQNPPCAAIGGSTYAVYRFDGTPIAGTAVDAFQITIPETIIGTPADGTWTVVSHTPFGAVCIGVNSKVSTFAQLGVTVALLQFSCIYNERSAGPSYSNDQCQTNVVAENDPNNAVYFSDQTAPDPNPTSFTTDNTVTCPSTATVRGIWIRGSTQVGNTFVRFAYIEGPAVRSGGPEDDLRSFPGVQFTTLTDDGAAANGDHAAAIFYNNAVGTSYQILTRAGATGTEDQGVPPTQTNGIVFIPPAQCTIGQPTLTGFVFDPADLEVEAAQAQCNDGVTKVSFAVNVGLTFVSHTLDATILEADTATPILLLAHADFNTVPTGGSQHVHYTSRLFPPGDYVIVVRLDVTGVGIADVFYGEAFNVPIGACAVTLVDYLVINTHTTQETTYRSNQTNTYVNQTLENVTHVHAEQHNQHSITNALINTTHTHIDLHFTEAFTQLSNIFTRLNTTCQKTAFSAVGCEGVENLCSAGGCNITVNNEDVITALGETEMRFIGLTTEESWTLLALIALMIWALYNEWWWAFAAMLLGVLGVTLGLAQYNAPLLVFLIILGFALQLLINQRKRRLEEEERKRQQASA